MQKIFIIQSNGGKHKSLIEAINQVKPAHIPIELQYKYILIKEIKNYTIDQILTTKIEELI